MTGPLTAEYLQAVERALLAGMGRGLMLSALDLDHVHRWARAGIPVEVVVAGIEKAFATKPRTTRGLAYAAPAVDAAIKVWLARRMGGDEPVAAAQADSEVLLALDDLMNRLTDAGLRHQPPVRFVLRDTWKSLNLLKERCLAGLESDPVGALDVLDQGTFEALWAVTPTETQQAIDAGVEASLRREASTAEAAVRDARRWKALRTRLGLPALALEVGGGW